MRVPMTLDYMRDRLEHIFTDVLRLSPDYSRKVVNMLPIEQVMRTVYLYEGEETQ
jgi:hypothetical protein